MTLTGEIVVDLATIDTGIALRNQHLRENYLEVAKGRGFDKAVLSEIRVHDADGEEFQGRTAFTGTLLLHGVRAGGGGHRRDPPRGFRGTSGSDFPADPDRFRGAAARVPGRGSGEQAAREGRVHRDAHAEPANEPARSSSCHGGSGGGGPRRPRSPSSFPVSTRVARAATSLRPAADCSRPTEGRSRARSFPPSARATHPGSPGREQEFLFGAAGDTLRPVSLGIDLRPSHLDVDSAGLHSTRDFLMNADLTAAMQRGRLDVLRPGRPAAARRRRARGVLRALGLVQDGKGPGDPRGPLPPRLRREARRPHRLQPLPRSTSTTTSRSTASS